MIEIIRALFFTINLVVLSTLIIIHFFIKDNSYAISLWFYAFPLPAIMGITLLFAFFLKRKQRLVNGIITLILMCIWIGRSYSFTLPGKLSENNLEIVFWNASHERSFSDVFNNLNKLPDLVVLVEYHAEILPEVKKKYPQYHFYKHPVKEIGIFSKTPIHIKNEFLSKYKTTVINFESKGINYYAVDVSASIDVPRQWEFGFVNDAVSANQSTVLLGDFNVPYESSLLTDIKKNFNHALTEKGNGFRETWFWNLPILSLDHIWVSKDLEILKAEKIITWKSDHSMVKVFIRN